jgi:uncharacterized protein
MAQGALIAVRNLPLLSVDVSELLRHPGTSTVLNFAKNLEGIGVPLSRLAEDQPAEFDLRLDALVDGIHASGSVEGEVVFECRRCLQEFRKPMAVEIDDVFLYPDESGDAEYRIEGDHVDLEPMVRDAFVLELPLNPLCREDCRGLCTVCGSDLNEIECGHSQEPVDITWNALQQLRRSLEE